MAIQNPFDLQLALDGEIVHQRAQGQRSLFLFNETHTSYEKISRNLKNTCLLLDQAVVGVVAVEGPYTLQDATDEEIAELGYFDEGETDAQVIERLIVEALETDQVQPGIPHFLFADALRILRPTAPICYVDNAELADQAEALNAFFGGQRTDELYAQLLAAKAADLNVEVAELDVGTMDAILAAAKKAALLEFREHAVQKARDAAFVSNMLNAWQAGIAVLNAGSAHLNRIAGTPENFLPLDVRFIQVG